MKVGLDDFLIMNGNDAFTDLVKKTPFDETILDISRLSLEVISLLEKNKFQMELKNQNHVVFEYAESGLNFTLEFEGLHVREDRVFTNTTFFVNRELRKLSLLDDAFLEERESTRRPYFMGSHLMDPGLSWVIADYVKKGKGRS